MSCEGDTVPSTEFLDVDMHLLTMAQTLALLAAVPEDAPFRFVVTPNVHHVLVLHGEGEDAGELRRTYRQAWLRLCDSRILSQLARRHGIRLPVVPGSDLTARLFAEVIAPGDTIAIVGGSERTLELLGGRYPGIVFRQHIPPMGLRHNQAAIAAAAQFVADSKARFSFLAVGAPQQEMLAARILELESARGIGLCIGASIEFVTGELRRAPRIVSRMHLEWAHRLLSDPRRLWRRYLVEGPRIFRLAAGWRPRAGGQPR